MQSRRDQVQAYFFVVERLVAALMHGRPDAPETPNRRVSTGVALGLILGALIAGVFGIYGLFVPGGNDSWQKAGVIIVEEETGARYLYLNGVLRPVLNYTSAKLALGDSSTTVSVSQNSITGVPVGSPIGIPGAPDSLPKTLQSGPWTVCTQPPDNATDGSTAKVTLMIGENVGAPAADSQGVLVSTSDGNRYLIWRGERYRLASDLAVDALGYGGVDPLAVTAAFISPIPSGPDLTTPQLSGRGQAGPMINGQQSHIGQVYDVKNSLINTDQLYLVRQDGMVPISKTVATLVMADPATAQAYPDGAPAPIQVNPGALVGLSIVHDADLSSGMPSSPPSLVDVGGTSVPCMRFSWGAGGNTSAALVLAAKSSVDADAVATEGHTAGAAADQVAIPAGNGVLAHDLSAPGATPGTEYLITENGMRFPLSSEQVAATLGYAETSAVNVPSQLLMLLPTGPVLDPAAALATEQVSG
ncbi:MAG TPA: type VII secretion protein EccB [Pseudonocardiaceae bacterium]|jgi:type VII secretion protein EccB|nr:type VII secretion protein EccB [Pseudonocardiaceae bacterium]